MLERIREARRNESGFTLIELLIVIVILGVLAGIVVFAVSAFNGDGKAAACKSDLKNVEIASEAYFAKEHQSAAGINNATPVAPLTAKDYLVGAGYLKEAPGNDGYTITFTPPVDRATGAGTVVGNLTGQSTNNCTTA